jgi:hypothetical protein
MVENIQLAIGLHKDKRNKESLDLMQVLNSTALSLHD